MLIAVMAQTFDDNRRIEVELLTKGKLSFVIENWWINPIGDSKSQIMYIIAALFEEEDEEDVEIMKELHEEVKLTRYEQDSRIKNISAQIKKIKIELDVRTQSKTETEPRVFDEIFANLYHMRENSKDFDVLQFRDKVEEAVTIFASEREQEMEDEKQEEQEEEEIQRNVDEAFIKMKTRMNIEEDL